MSEETKSQASQGKHTITVYIDNGICYSYYVSSEEEAHDHTSAIVATGYRHTDSVTRVMTHYPPHRITKVKATGITTQHLDFLDVVDTTQHPDFLDVVDII